MALKLPHSGSSIAASSSASRANARSSPALEHPHIARLYDAGVDERGRPYLALEYVDGVPPDEYCRPERLTLREKLKLFLEILRAVAFAHARLIVHRDLKPNNILIAADCDVRLLDFGIARLLQPDTGVRAQQAANHTLIGAAALTPAYAAPEQFTGQPITVATDVYSLGVILFEMLTGASPYCAQRPVARRLRTRSAARRAAADEPRGAARRGRALRGDLDAIVAKALEKKPADRYVSVEASRVDIERHHGRRADRGAAAFILLRREENSCGAMPGRLSIRRQRRCCCWRARSGFAVWQWNDAERQSAMAVRTARRFARRGGIHLDRAHREHPARTDR